MNKGVVAGRWWNMATGIARWQKREKEPRGLGRERGTTFERQRQRERERERERERGRRIERQSDKERRRKRESDEAGDDQYAISLNYNNNGDQTKLSALL